MTVRIKRPQARSNVHIKGGKMLDLKAARGGDLESWREEIAEFWDVLLGRKEPPIERGLHSLQEVATAYYARAKEIHAIIKDAEADGSVLRKSGEYKFRTGALRDFIEVASKAAELGSRRITHAELLLKMKLDYGDAEDLD